MYEHVKNDVKSQIYYFHNKEYILYFVNMIY